jgi:hypothetical protein
MRKRNNRLSFDKINLDQIRKDIAHNEKNIEYARKFLLDTNPNRDMKHITPEILLEISRRLRQTNPFEVGGLLLCHNMKRSFGRL